MCRESAVLVVDEDRAIRVSLQSLLQGAGYVVRTYQSSEALLSDDGRNGGCLIVETGNHGVEGLALHKEIGRRGLALPFIVLTAKGGVSLAVEAMKAGAADVFEKPVDGAALLASVAGIFEQAGLKQNSDEAGMVARGLLANLTERERQVFDKIVSGLSNKAAGDALNISSRTIEIHRARIMNKCRARNLSDLVRASIDAKPPATFVA